MKHIVHLSLCLVALVTMSCRSSSYTEPSCANASDPGCSPFIQTITAPSSLVATALDAGKIKVTWTKPDFKDSFVTVLEMKEFGTDEFSGVQVLDDTQDSFTVGNLEPLTKYIFRVKAVAGESESDYTSEADATTLAQVVNSLFPIPTSTITHNTIGTIKIANAWTNSTYSSWVSSVQYQHKKENGGEWSTIAMGTYAALSAQFIDNTPPKGYVVYRMVVTYTDQSVYKTAPSTHIIAALEKPAPFSVSNITLSSGTIKHHVEWGYGEVPPEMSGFQLLAYYSNGTGVGPSNLIPSTDTSMNFLPNACPSGTEVSYWMRALSSHPLISPSDVTPIVVKTCP